MRGWHADRHRCRTQAHRDGSRVERWLDTLVIVTSRIVITGAPGTGKTTLVSALTYLGGVVPEPARALIAEHRRSAGEHSLDHRPALFIERLIERSIVAFDEVPESGELFYDRGLPDCIAYADVLAVDTATARHAARKRRYSDPVFVCPPWRDIYVTDDMRRATFEQVEAFHVSLVEGYESLGYRLQEVPRASVPERVAFVESTLDLGW